MIIQRTELKYIIPIKDYSRLRKRLEPFCRKDGFLKGDQDAYQVNSIYFETPNFDYYNDKISGIELRKKFRIRYYGDIQPTGDSQQVFIELKQKYGPLIKKLRHVSSWRDFQKILTHQTSIEDQNLGKIFFQFFMDQLSPVVNISYQRAPLIGIFERDTRITFDSQITAASVRDKGFGQVETNQKQSYLLSPFYFLLEIKITDSIPTWLSHIIEEFNLEVTAFSKYAKGIENCGIMMKERGEINE